MRIAVDMDEVLADLVGPILRRWNDLNGTNFDKSHIDVFRMESTLGVDRTGRPAEGLIDEWMNEKGFFSSLDPMPGAIEGLNILRKNHDVLIVTSVPERLVGVFDEKRAWMRKHFPDISMKSVIACSRKGCIDADVLIDDAEHNIVDFTEAGGEAIVFDAAWNRNMTKYKYLHLIRRAETWGDVVDLVEQLPF